MIKSFLYALQFLTIIPIKIKGNADERELGRSTAFFPLVGAVQGIILVGTNIIFSKLLSPDIASALVLIVLILTNGGFHLDGFADTIDGIAGGNTKEARLQIMKDSNIGAIAVVAIVLLLLLKFLAIGAIANRHLSASGGPSSNYILFLLPVMGRWSMVPMAYWTDYARPAAGLGRAFTEYTRLRELLLAGAFTLLFSAALLRWSGLVYFGVICAATYLFSLFFKKRLGGVTGDVFGFQCEVSEVAFLLISFIQLEDMVW